jgi:oxaloacetate decarboxylase alpha subunit
MFPKVAPKFFTERTKGPISSDSFAVPKSSGGGSGSYAVNVNGTSYQVTTASSGDNMNVTVNGTSYNVAFGAASASSAPAAASSGTGGGADITAPVAGTLIKHVVPAGTNVSAGQTVIMIESMKMELEVKATTSGVVSYSVNPGAQITSGQVLGKIGGGAVTPAPAAAAPAKPAAAAAPAVQAPSGTGAVVNAPVAGTLLKNVLAEGAAVTSGQTIVVIESMKMELEIKAASNGSVHYLGTPGSQISSGQPLAEIK